MTSRRLMIHPKGTDKAANTKRWGHIPAINHVCIGSFSTELGCPRHVRFTPDRDRGTDMPIRPLRAQEETHAPQHVALLFDHLIGAGEQRRQRNYA
jgi:hypothetical protein